jgi:hypothetical protein
MITIDQRGCGQGKTTNGIYQRIQDNYSNNIKTLIVVPSIKLQYQYSEGLDLPITIINSEIYNEKSEINSTVKAAINSMRRGDMIITITHQCFVKLPTSGYKSNYSLIIDEALDEIICKTNIAAANNEVWNPNFDLYNLFQFKSNLVEQEVDLTPEDDAKYHQLIQIREPSQSLLSDSPSFRQITDKNYIHYVTSKGWNILNQQTGGNTNVISVLDIEVLKNWHDVYIAAAAFNKTKMYYWLKSHNIKTYTPRHLEFVPHKGNVKLFTSNNSKFVWSNNKRKTYPEILQNYHNFVKENSIGKVLTIRNNSESQSMGNSEKRVNHNVHGMNDLQEYFDISLETALIPDPAIKNFIVDNWLVLENEYQRKRALTHMFSAYLFYQVIMRTKLRSRDYNNERINVFVIDQDTGVCISDYFATLSDIGEMDITSNIALKPRGAPLKYITEEEKQRQKEIKRERDKKRIALKRQIQKNVANNPL